MSLLTSISPMASIRYLDIIFSFVLLLCFLFLWYKISLSRPKNSFLPIKWPLVGSLPGLIRNSWRLHEFITEVLQECGGTILSELPFHAKMGALVTSDPANINYILTKNFTNFSKGDRFKDMFDVFGYGIVNSSNKSWEMHRKYACTFIQQQSFQKFVISTTCNKVKNGLIPVLDSLNTSESEIRYVDLQELFNRFTFDNSCTLVLGHDPATLSVGLPAHQTQKVFHHVMEGLFYRHLLPENLWKLQRWLNIGKEKRLNDAWKTIDQFLSKCISSKRKAALIVDQEAEGSHDLLTSYVQVCEDLKSVASPGVDSDIVLRDTLWNLLLAGTDTVSAALTWFFWLLSKNPLVEAKIRQEIVTKMHVEEGTNWSPAGGGDVRKLIYLRGALCEALRLFPPVAFEYKDVVQPDILPSGHRIEKHTQILISFYAMGRMKSIWGEDCLEFKPQRWITEKGEIKHEPSFKFTAFNAGPRSCVGKEIALMQMQIIAATIIYGYKIEVVKGHPVSPTDSVIILMKHGLMVSVTKRPV